MTTLQTYSLLLLLLLLVIHCYLVLVLLVAWYRAHLLYCTVRVGVQSGSPYLCTLSSLGVFPPLYTAHSMAHLSPPCRDNQGPRLPPRQEMRYLAAFEELMTRWKDSDIDFFVPQLAAVLMSKGTPSRNVHVSEEACSKGGGRFNHDNNHAVLHGSLASHAKNKQCRDKATCRIIACHSVWLKDGVGW